MIEYTVTQIVNKLIDTIDIPELTNITIKGEVTNFNGRYPSGHLYFSIKDDNSSIACVMFNGYASKLNFELTNGDKVILIGSPSIYNKTGKLQINVVSMKKDGKGDLLQQFEELKKKLTDKGYFNEEHKKTLSIKYPNSVGVIVGDNSAAMSDIKRTFERRWPLCNVVFYPSIVQGDKAPEDLIKNLLNADKNNHDALIIARGGGSFEDLFCFNDENLVKTIYDLNTFIVSGVGHEQDFTLCDFVVDKRASTPTAASEYLTPNIKDVMQDLDNYLYELNNIINTNLTSYRKSLDSYILNIKNYSNKFTSLSKDINTYKDNMKNIISIKISSLKEYVNSKKELIKMYSIDDTLKRGYSIVYKDSKIINSSKSLKKNDEIDIKLYKSKLKAIVKEN